ncbi:(d)CMP kinase [Gorillibacterium massiliense]|uniref:(d)CMP kinase n=1 Tax=Gorillibacterium massiliense TaxID=1280390 RepID=UPI0004B838E7|nr:(d)CMP kinase [Gorillibacterium massiliense]
MVKFNIALDGPAGAGKSTVARLVAKELGFVYVDTGSMYRAVTWKIIQLGLRTDDTPAIVTAAQNLKLELKPGDNGQQVFVDGVDVTSLIRSAEINANVSQVSQIPEIRQRLTDIQKNLATGKGIVMDGRDIGTKVLPDAEVKVFLTASARRRAERRYKEAPDSAMTLDELEADITRRDRMDAERELSPLRKAEDAVRLDTTELALDEVVQAVLQLCRTKVNGGK